MQNLIDRLLYSISCDQVKILLDRMDMQPEAFAVNRRGIWDSYDMPWVEIAIHGTYRPYERWAINKKLHRIKLKTSRDNILAALVCEGQKPLATAPSVDMKNQNATPVMGIRNGGDAGIEYWHTGYAYATAAQQQQLQEICVNKYRQQKERTEKERRDNANPSY